MKTDKKTTFNYRLLKSLRGQKKFSLSDMVFELRSVGLKVADNTYLNWETGETEPKFSQVVLLSKYFKKPLSKFRGDK